MLFMLVSIILPTYNRAEILRKTLQGYANQSCGQQMFEVLVVDDGSKDHTAKAVEECRDLFSSPILYLRQENGGLAAARNRGIRESRGELILFGDDDIIPSRAMVAEHIAWHSAHPEPNVGVLGFVTWASELRPTPFMIWSGLRGPQFHFGEFEPGKELDFWHSYFCNTSVKARFLNENVGVFSETFRQYGWEDIELSYRLHQKGYKLLYNPLAVGYHYKFERFNDTLKRVRELNRSLPVFENTEAGRCFVEMSRRQSIQTTKRMSGIVRRSFKAVKELVIPLFRPLLDTRIPLPAWLYDRVLYHYVSLKLPDDPTVTREWPGCTDSGT
jgi:glycosyltransferase involved in cell wall biosynthesis